MEREARSGLGDLFRRPEWPERPSNTLPRLVSHDPAKASPHMDKDSPLSQLSQTSSPDLPVLSTDSD